MSISIHIPFYNPNPQKKEGFRQLTRFDFLKENIENLKKLSIKNDIFIHTHNNYLDDKKLEAQIITHKINEKDLEKGHLTWLSRPLMEKQKNDYDFFMYLEHDIGFSEKNLQYFLEHQDQLSEKKFHLGYLIYEQNHKDHKKYCIHLTNKLTKFIKIDKQIFFLNDVENYCCFWIYNKKIFNNFVKTKWWSFEKKLTNFRHHYGITERSSLGYHALNINYFRATLLPQVNNKLDPNCFVEHMTNNYFDKFSDIDKLEYDDIRGACKFDIENLHEENLNQKEIKDNLYLRKVIKIILWKFRILNRVVKKLFKC